MTATPGFERFGALGGLAVIGAADAGRLDAVVTAVADEIDACDRACSRFRADSELSRLNAGEPVRASAWLCDAVAIALQAAVQTDGLVDPTVGQALIDLGYDRSFDRLDPDTPLTVTTAHVPAWRSVTVDPLRKRVNIPPRVRLDLGATAKALCADRAAVRAAAECGTGVMVSLGGDIAVAGRPPDEGWIVRVTDRADGVGDSSTIGQTVAVRVGGLASSGTSARRWARAGVDLHHIVDPRTGRSTEDVWRTVTVAGRSCVAANTASTAAIILGFDAPSWLAGGAWDARLVAADGRVVTTGNWPSEHPADAGALA